MEKVQNFIIPITLTELRDFIGLAFYYRHFIKDFATITTPLNKLLKKDQPFEWTENCNNAFEILKKALTTAPILSYPDFNQPFILSMNASYNGLGAILGQKDEEGKEHIIAYTSRSLNKTE